MNKCSHLEKDVLFDRVLITELRMITVKYRSIFKYVEYNDYYLLDVKISQNATKITCTNILDMSSRLSLVKSSLEIVLYHRRVELFRVELKVNRLISVVHRGVLKC